MAWTRPGGTVWLWTLIRPWRSRRPSGESATVNPKYRVNWAKTRQQGQTAGDQDQQQPVGPSVAVTSRTPAVVWRQEDGLAAQEQAHGQVAGRHRREHDLGGLPHVRATPAARAMISARRACASVSVR